MLAALPDYEPFAAFQRVNRKQDGRVTPLEIYSFLRDNGVTYITLRDCYFILKYFDTNGDKTLSYSEFMQVMLPCDDMYLRAAATQRPNYPVGRYEKLPP